MDVSIDLAEAKQLCVLSEIGDFFLFRADNTFDLLVNCDLYICALFFSIG